MIMMMPRLRIILLVLLIHYILNIIAVSSESSTTTYDNINKTRINSSSYNNNVDHPIAVSSSSSTKNPIYYLDGNDWIAKCSTCNLTIDATVPGDLITDLQNAGIIDDPYYELNWIQQQRHNSSTSLWQSNNWIYQRNFTLPPATTSESSNNNNNNSVWLIVFDGIKMGARMSINGHIVGIVKNQFLRYKFEIPSNILLLHHAAENNNNNTIEVEFDDDKIDVEGRFMACTGGWDWAPYSYTTINGSTGIVNSFSKGIWKSVYLLEVQPKQAPVITHMTPHTTYLGDYPILPLLDGHHGGFIVNVTIHLWVPPIPSSSSSSDNKKVIVTKGYLEVDGTWGDGTHNSTNQLYLTEGDTVISLQLSAQAKDIRLWWPAGMMKTGRIGERQQQPLYNVTATWHSSCSSSSSDNDDVAIIMGTSSNIRSTSGTTVITTTATRRIGFRVFALVTTNDTDIATNIRQKQQQQQQEGSGSHGMYFRINGAAIYSRGANVVPMEELEGRSSGIAHRILVKSAVDANFNTIRVWGGGIFFPRDFYDACDEYGILLYHDMQYSSNNGGPHGPISSSITQQNEIRYQIRRLSHHPSIVLWDGVNEVVVGPDDPSNVFARFVMTIVAQEDQSRAIWPSSPAKGWLTGVDTLYGKPLLNGRPLTTQGGGHIWDQGIETHAPYQLGSGWPVINGAEADSCWDRWHLVHIPPILNPHNTKFGVQEKNVYASEFGVTGSPSFESLSGTLAKHHWGIHGGDKPDICTGACQNERHCTQNNVMTQRNYACDAGIRLWMGNTTAIGRLLNATGEHALKAQTYLCQLVQALDQKSVIEERRGKNQFGALVWMLNDIWPTISWGSLEYGSISYTKGQLLGGRWKQMHYFYKRSLFADIIATCGIRYHSANDKDWVCYVKNDRAGSDFHGTITLTTYNLMGDGTPEVFLRRHVNLPAGPGVVEWFDPTASSPSIQKMPNPNTTAVYCTVHDDDDDVDGSLVSEHLLTLTMPKNLHVPCTKLSYQISNTSNADGTIDITVTSDRVALWVTLTSGAHGRFTDNAFFLPATTKNIQFVPFVESNDGHLQILERTLRIEDFSTYCTCTVRNNHPVLLDSLAYS